MLIFVEIRKYGPSYVGEYLISTLCRVRASLMSYAKTLLDVLPEEAVQLH